MLVPCQLSFVLTSTLSPHNFWIFKTIIMINKINANDPEAVCPHPISQQLHVRDGKKKKWGHRPPWKIWSPHPRLWKILKRRRTSSFQMCNPRHSGTPAYTQSLTHYTSGPDSCVSRTHMAIQYLHLHWKVHVVDSVLRRCVKHNVGGVVSGLQTKQSIRWCNQSNIQLNLNRM